MNPLDGSYASTGDGFCFSNGDEARAAISKSQWSPAVDDTIPTTTAQEKGYVRQLCDAFKDTTTTQDAQGSVYRRRFTDGFYQDWMVEARAWSIVEITKKIHQQGFSAHIFDANLLALIQQTKDWTFAERIYSLCVALKISKNVAVTLMKDEKIMTAIGAPHKLIINSKSNHKSNEARNRWVKEGRTRETAAKHESPAIESEPARDDAPWDLNNDPLVRDAIATVNRLANPTTDTADRNFAGPSTAATHADQPMNESEPFSEISTRQSNHSNAHGLSFGRLP